MFNNDVEEHKVCTWLANDTVYGSTIRIAFPESLKKLYGIVFLKASPARSVPAFLESYCERSFTGIVCTCWTFLLEAFS